MSDKQRKRRLLLGAGLFFAAMLAFIGNLVYLQVIQGEAYLAQSVRKIVRTETVEAARGQVLDRYGAPLVSNRISYQLSLDLGQMGELRDETLLTLMTLCSDVGLSWGDNLPVSMDAPYLYTKETTAETGLRRYDQYLSAIDLKEPAKAQALIDGLSQHYDIQADCSPQERRALVGILYESALRAKEITWTGYIFVSDVDMAFITRIKELGLPGVTVTPTAARIYETAAAAHILGRVGQMNEAEWAVYQEQGYGMDALVGKDGAEEAFESYLHGTPGERTLETDTRGKVVGEIYTAEPTPGSNVILTLDLALQEKTEEILSELVPRLSSAEGAAVAILDVKDGSVLTLASYPTFDLSQFSKLYDSVREDPLRPLYNRALQGTYAPGSTYKMVVAAAGLETGLITPETKVLDTGKYTYYSTPQPRCWLYRETGRTHGLETVTEAITDSCNIFFYDLGRRLGIDLLDDYSRQFGLGESTGIELSGESLGVVAGPEYTRAQGQTWYEGNTLSAAIGQENNRFTPLQLASYVATLANGGTRFQAHLLKAVSSNDGKDTILEYSPALLGSVSLSEANLTAVKEGMLAVTQSGSVASYFRSLDVKVAAKTGSAQVTGHEEANAVFVCFAPYDDPQIAMAIVVEKGGSGSELGAIASEILRYYFAQAPTQGENPDALGEEIAQ